VTFTIVVMVVAPDVPVTVNDAGPFGVPDEPVAPDPLLPVVLHPARARANRNIAKQAQVAGRKRGTRSHAIALTRIKVARSIENSKPPGISGGAFCGVGGTVETTIVVSLRLTVVPAGAGVAGFVSNEQVVLAGSPEQLSIKLRFEPAGAKTVSGMVRLCPCETVSSDVGGAKPTTTSARGSEFAAANCESPSYWATREFGPAASEEVVRVACPPDSVPVPSETPLLKKVTVPVGVPEAVLATVAVSVTGC